MNWLIYDGGAPTGLLGMAEGSSSSEVHSVARGKIRERQLSYLPDLARDQLPPWHAEVVLGTREPYAQSLYDLEIDRYARGRVCLIGDAATVARPDTGSGATKALQVYLGARLAVLQDDFDDRGTHYQDAALDEHGTLTITCRDQGPGVSEFFGSDIICYEWVYVVASHRVPALIRILAGTTVTTCSRSSPTTASTHRNSLAA